MEKGIRCGVLFAFIILSLSIGVTGSFGRIALAQQPEPFFAYTHQQPDGNRFIAGRGIMPFTAPLDIELAGQPQWLLAGPLSKGTAWVTVLADGRVQAFRVIGQTVTPMEIEPANLPTGAPPLLKIEGDVPSLITLPPEASPMAYPVALPGGGGQIAYVEQNGDLVIRGAEGEVARAAIDALPDARLLVDDRKRILVLTDPTTRYEHGVLGDDLEAGGVMLIATEPELAILMHLVFVDGTVAEQIMPLWADLSGDRRREIILTLSTAEDGAQVVALDDQGQPLAGGAPVGESKKWRHVVAVAPFGPDGTLELVSVLTPHTGGVVEFYRWGDHRLDVVAQLPGYTSHAVGSRNFDQAAAGDFDGDDRVEFLIPGQSLRSLIAIRRTEEGAEEAWSVPVDGVVSTNLATVVFPDGGLGVGVGYGGKGLRLWLPQ